MNKKVVKEIVEWVLCILAAVVLAILVRTFIGTPTVVQQTSMYPTLEDGDRLWLNKFAIKIGTELKRGDIITLESPINNIVSASAVDLNYPVAEYGKEPEGFWECFKYYVLEEGKKSYIKRVIAVEGEHIKIENGKVYINDEEIVEDYLKPGVETTSLSGQFTDLVVPKGCVYVLGDNRGGSTDSRRFGCVPLSRVESLVGIRFWPISKFGSIDD